MSALQVQIVTICDKPGNRYCGTWNWLPIRFDNGAGFLKGKFEMKIRKAAYQGLALLVSISVALPGIANPDNLFPIKPENDITKTLPQWLCHVFQKLTVVMLLAIVSTAALPVSAEAKLQNDKVHLLTISACPPHNLHIPLEVCRNTSEMVAWSLMQALSVPSENVVSLVNDDATGEIVLKRLTAYAQELDESETLIVYLNAHGARYADWLKANVPSPEIRKMVSGSLPSDSYTLQFWSESPVGLPPVALANQTLVPFDDVMAMLGAIPARVALILDSCYAELASISDRPENLELLVVASGDDQVANVTRDGRASLFGYALAEALSGTDSATLGGALSAATERTVEMAREACGSMKVSRDVFAMILPDEPLPSDAEGDRDIALPDWYCVQVPATFVYNEAIWNLPMNS